MFDKIFDKKLFEINLESNTQWQQKLSEENKFIRFKFNESYMDLTIRKILFKTEYTILLGDIIDYNRPDFYQEKVKNKRNSKTK